MIVRMLVCRSSSGCGQHEDALGQIGHHHHLRDWSKIPLVCMRMRWCAANDERVSFNNECRPCCAKYYRWWLKTVKTAKHVDHRAIFPQPIHLSGTHHTLYISARAVPCRCTPPPCSCLRSRTSTSRGLGHCCPALTNLAAYRLTSPWWCRRCSASSDARWAHV